MFAIEVFGIGFKISSFVVTCRRYDTGCEGRDNGEVSDQTGEELATPYGPSRPMRGSGGRGSDGLDGRLWVKIAPMDGPIQQAIEGFKWFIF